MFKMINRSVTLKVVCEYEFNGVTFDYLAHVTINRQYEVENVLLTAIECYDQYGNYVEFDPSFTEQLETIAGAKAIEKAQESDFENHGEIYE